MTDERANFIGAPAFFDLNQACRVLTEAFGFCVYLVGSAIRQRDYRDVDVRAILPDEEYDRLFPGHAGAAWNAKWHPLWSIVCSSISLYLSQHSGLPVDFQIQRRSDANAEFSGQRQAIGLFLGGSTP